MDGYKHYIRTDETGTIVHGFSDAFEQPQDGDILIAEDGPRHFHLYWPEPLVNERSQYRYKWENGQRVERSQAELDAEWAARPVAPKTPEQEMNEQIAALMIDSAAKDIQLQQQDAIIADLMLQVAALQTGGGGA